MLKLHPVFKNYGYNQETKEIMNTINNSVLKVYDIPTGYQVISVKHNDKHRCYSCHRFIFECLNDIIPSGYEIDHINKVKNDNDPANLRLVTVSKNRQERDYTNIIKMCSTAWKRMKPIKAIKRDDTSVSYCFNSKNQCGKFFNISPAMVYLICEKVGYYTNANTNQGKFYFEYATEDYKENFIKIPHGRLGKKYVYQKRFKELVI